MFKEDSSISLNDGAEYVFRLAVQSAGLTVTSALSWYKYKKQF